MPSAASMTRRPIASAAARATATASGLVSTPAITSTRRITGGGLKKCMPTTRWGTPEAAPIAVTGMDDVLLARTASVRSASSRRISPLSSRRSGAASMTRSQPSRSSMPAAGCSRSRAPSTGRRSHAASMRRTPRSSAPGTGSCRTVSSPDCAASWAIPPPIVPAPTTPTLRGLDMACTVHSPACER